MSTREWAGLATEFRLALWAARETGVLDVLVDRAGTPEEVVAETDVTPEAAAVMVEVLADLGLLTRVDGEYEPTNAALGLLAKRDVRSIGGVPHAIDDVDELVDLPTTMETGVPPERGDDWTANALGAHAATDEAFVRAAVTAAVRAAPDAERVVDLCGGSGVYAAEFAARGRAVTLVDSAEAVDLVEPLYDDANVTVHAGTPATLGGPFDLAFGADVATAMDPGELAALVGAAAAVLGPEGTLVLVETVADGSGGATAADVRGLASGHGGAHAAADYREWFADAGFADTAVEPVPGTDAHAVVGYKHMVD
ncbi:class I SAM-dependent methyltransferase [Candidatus Halobonum tyrrellensis]|uniref:SAM-dependent methyltransferase n=1 Tax=Candidatus Halobonum tyrrellensis G22 TaxID=1324957 RepID=V4HA71_9EURY|nr:class I SAM-dependent methyltransferase [Candidatus Halobonum tyrrellensis]ESP87610.1 hypothetical protein K933_13232 [Candidatus Halobonum tyrrellensis G22]